MGTASARTAGTLCQRLLDGYASALAQGKAYWVERDTAQGLVRELLDGLRQRERSTFLDLRTTTKGRRRLLRVDGKKALAATAAQRDTVTGFVDAYAKSQPDPDFYQVLDVARRIAGTGSLDVDRYVILVTGKGSPNGNYLLDLKRALPSSLAPHLKLAQPAWKTEALRIVTLQRRLQAVSMARLHPVLVGQGAVPGIGLAIVIAVTEFPWDGWRPHAAALGRVDGGKDYHDIARHPEARVVPAQSAARTAAFRS